MTKHCVLHRYEAASVPDVLRDVNILCRSLELIVGLSTSTNLTPLSTYIAPHGGVMVSMLASSAVDRGFDSRSGQIKDYKIGICCSSAKHAALRSKRKDWLAWNQVNVNEWSDKTTSVLNSK